MEETEKIMATELVDANTQTETPAPQFDGQALANAIGMQVAHAVKENQPKKEEVDYLSMTVAQMKNAGAPDEEIQRTITLGLNLQKDFTEKLKATEEKATKQFNQALYQKDINKAISSSVRSYSKDDELISEAAPALREKALSEFWNSSTPAVVTARNKFLQQGDLDEDVIDDIVGKYVKRIDAAVEKRTGKKSQASPTLTPSDTTARPGGASDASNLNRDNMTALQERIYDATFQAISRSKSPEEAKAAALRAAARVKK